MRLQIEFSNNTQPVPFTYINNLNGYLHKVIGGNNKYHDDISIYSSSFLYGGKMNPDRKSLNFKNGAKWFISSPDENFILTFAKNVYNNINFAYGMELIGVNLIEEQPVLKGSEGYTMYPKSPVLLKQRDFDTKKNIYYTFEDDNEVTSNLMKNLLMKKINKCGVNIKKDDFDLSFDTSYDKKKIKWIAVKSVNNKTSVCPIKIKTKKEEVISFIKNVGIGHSTGSGFGFVY